ncbi:retrovirus-related pol polyprotein from transposon TNT 1-94 [Tanacetum coccineum]
MLLEHNDLQTFGINGKHSDTVSPRSLITHFLHKTSTTQQQLCPITFIQQELPASSNANREDILNPTTALDMALELMAKAFQLNNTTPINNNQRSSSKPCYSQVAQSVQNQGIQNVGNQNGLSVISGIANQHGNGNVVAARAEGNGNGINGNPIKCYNCQGEGHYASNCTLKPRKMDAAYLQTQLQIAQKKEQASTSGTQTNNTLVYDSDGPAEISNVEQGVRTVQQHSTTVEETCAYHESLFHNLAAEVEKVKSVNRKMKETNAELTTELARYKNQEKEKCFVSEQKDTTKGTSVNTQRKQSILGKPPSSSGPKLYYVTPLPKSKVIPKVGESNALSKPVTSNSAPSSCESIVVNNERVIAPGIFRINLFKAPRDFVPNKHVKASARTKSMTVSQPHDITKKDVNSITNGFSPKNIESTTRTRRPQPRNNPKSDKVPFKSKSSCLSNKLEKIEENHRSLQSFDYPDHTSSECNNIKLAIRNEKYEVICVTCKQCLITSNHDECVLQYVNGMKSRKKNQSANVSKIEN